MVARQIEAGEPDCAAAIRANVRACYGSADRLDVPPTEIARFNRSARERQLALALTVQRAGQPARSV